MSPGDLIVYSHAEGDRPAQYLGRHGSQHLITIPAHGGQAGRGLRYVESEAIRPACFQINGEAK